jgi:hypothetical protein
LACCQSKVLASLAQLLRIQHRVDCLPGDSALSGMLGVLRSIEWLQQISRLSLLIYKLLVIPRYVTLCPFSLFFLRVSCALSRFASRRVSSFAEFNCSCDGLAILFVFTCCICHLSMHHNCPQTSRRMGSRRITGVALPLLLGLPRLAVEQPPAVPEKEFIQEAESTVHCR